MDCRDAQFYLRLRRPASNELDPDASAALDRHLAACPGCAAAGRALADFDGAVTRAMTAVPVPDGLRARLVANAAAQRGVAARRKAYRLLATAASLIVTCGLAYGVYTAARPTADVSALVRDADELFQPQGAEKLIAAFLRAQKLPALPESFDPSLCVHVGTESKQGRDVPVLVYRERNGPGVAKVFAYRGTDFKLDAIRDEQASHFSAKTYPSVGVTYVVVFTGVDLTPFLRGGGVAPV